MCIAVHGAHFLIIPLFQVAWSALWVSHLWILGSLLSVCRSVGTCWNMLKPRSLRNIDKNHDDCNHPTASIVSFLGRWRFVGRVPGVLHPHLEDLSWNCFDGEDFQQMGKQLMQTKPGCLVFDFRCVACVARRSSPVSSVLYFSHPFTCSLHLFTSEFTHFYPMLTTSLQALQSALWRMPSPFLIFLEHVFHTFCTSRGVQSWRSSTWTAHPQQWEISIAPFLSHLARDKKYKKYKKAPWYHLWWLTLVELLSIAVIRG